MKKYQDVEPERFHGIIDNSEFFCKTRRLGNPEALILNVDNGWSGDVASLFEGACTIQYITVLLTPYCVSDT